MLKFSGLRSDITEEIIVLLRKNSGELLTHLKKPRLPQGRLPAASNQIALWLESKMGNKGGHIHNGVIKQFRGILPARRSDKLLLRYLRNMIS